MSGASDTMVRVWDAEHGGTNKNRLGIEGNVKFFAVSADTREAMLLFADDTGTCAEHGQDPTIQGRCASVGGMLRVASSSVMCWKGTRTGWKLWRLALKAIAFCPHLGTRLFEWNIYAAATSLPLLKVFSQSASIM